MFTLILTVCRNAEYSEIYVDLRISDQINVEILL